MSLSEKNRDLDISHSHIVNVIKLFRKVGCYDSTVFSQEHNDVIRVLDRLSSADYKTELLENHGKLCANYPAYLVVPMSHWFKSFEAPDINVPAPPERMTDDSLVPEGSLRSENCVLSDRNLDLDVEERVVMQEGPLQDQVSGEELRDIMHEAMYGRSRKRFVIPVLLYNGKYISRSSTVPLCKEVLFRESCDTFRNWFPKVPDFTNLGIDGLVEMANNTVSQLKNNLLSAVDTVKETVQSVTEVKLEDIQKLGETISKFSTEDVKEKLDEGHRCAKADVMLLKCLKIKAIFDLMVEHGKVKYGVQCSSSEKEVAEWYEDFEVNSIPFPGCEFFEKFSKDHKKAPGLKFDWDDPQVNSVLFFQTHKLYNLQEKWDYKEWGLVHLTSVYLLAMLKYLKESIPYEGLLVHCISGWDRTPLFVSLLRISLWADGEAHQSLNPLQMLYYTIAYDWMLFGHNLKNRENKNEEIMLFCFAFLKFIACEHFSVKSESFGTFNDYSVEMGFTSPNSSLNSFCEVENSSGRVDSAASNPPEAANKGESPEPQLASLSPKTDKNGDDRATSPQSEKSDQNGVSADSDGFGEISSYCEGNSICLKFCSACEAKSEEVKETTRYKKINMLRKAYYDCFRRSLPDVLPPNMSLLASVAREMGVSDVGAELSTKL